MQIADNSRRPGRPITNQPSTVLLPGIDQVTGFELGIAKGDDGVSI